MFFGGVKNWYQFLLHVKNWYQLPELQINISRKISSSVLRLAFRIVTQAGGSSRKHRGTAHLKQSNSCPRSSNSKTLEFSFTFIKLWYACEELESNAKCSSFGGGGGGGVVFYRCEEYA